MYSIFVDSTSFYQTKMSYPIYPDSAAIYFLISRTLSIQSSLPSCLLQLTLLHVLHLKWIISIILIVLPYIFLSPGPYPFNLFYFVDSTSFYQTKMSYPIYPESAAIYFIISRTLSFQYFLPSCLLHSLHFMFSI